MIFSPKSSPQILNPIPCCSLPHTSIHDSPFLSPCSHGCPTDQQSWRPSLAADQQQAECSPFPCWPSSPLRSYPAGSNSGSSRSGDSPLSRSAQHLRRAPDPLHGDSATPPAGQPSSPADRTATNSPWHPSTARNSPNLQAV